MGRFRPIATASMGALTSIPPPVKRTVGFVVVDMALAALAAAAARTAHNFIASWQQH